MRKLNIGLTVQINDKKDSFWVNGIKQNAVTLRDMFELCPNVASSKLVNLGSLKDFTGSAWEEYAHNIIRFEEAADTLDVLITATVTPSEEMVQVLISKNIPIVKHIMGNELLGFQQHSIFNFENQFNSFSRRKNHKAIWISPHLFEQNKDFFEVITDSPASIGPYIWTPRFIEQHVNSFVKEGRYPDSYKPSGKKEKRVSVFEPNLTLEKTSVHPTIALEKFYRKRPDLLEFANIFGGDKLKSKKIFVEWAASMDIAKDKKIFFESRYPIVWSLFEHTDIMLCHQDMLPLNYIYFDAAWLGFPVIHNAYMVKDLGFFYPKWDSEEASKLLVDVAENFDTKYRDGYMKKSRKIIKKFLWNHPKNIEGYANLLDKVA